MTITSSPTISVVAQIRALHDRLLKAEALVASGKVHPVYGMHDHYIVDGKEAKYLISSTACVCPDSVNRPELKWCKHRLSVEIYKEQEAIAETPKVSKAVNNASTTPPETDRPIEDLLEDLYPKARSASLPR